MTREEAELIEATECWFTGKGGPYGCPDTVFLRDRLFAAARALGRARKWKAEHTRKPQKKAVTSK